MINKQHMGHSDRLKILLRLHVAHDNRIICCHAAIRTADLTLSKCFVNMGYPFKASLMRVILPHFSPLLTYKIIFHVET